MKTDDRAPSLPDHVGQASEAGRLPEGGKPAGAPFSLAQVRDLRACGSALRTRALLVGVAAMLVALALTRTAQCAPEPRAEKPASPVVPGEAAGARPAAAAPARPAGVKRAPVAQVRRRPAGAKQAAAARVKPVEVKPAAAAPAKPVGMEPAAVAPVDPLGMKPAAAAPAPQQPAPQSRAPIGSGRTEEEIPLNLDGPAAGRKDGGSFRLLTWLLGVAWKLGVVLALAYGCLHVLRRFVPGASAAAPGADTGVRRTIVLGPGRSVHLLEVEGHRILIGSTPQQLCLLADLTETVVSGDGGEGALETAAGEGGDFREHLGAFLAGRVAPSADPDPATEKAPAVAEAAPTAQVFGPETYTDAELREEVRRRLFALNRSAAGLQKLGERPGKGEQETWPRR